MHRKFFYKLVSQIDSSSLVGTSEDERDIIEERDAYYASWNLIRPKELSLQLQFDSSGRMSVWLQEIENPHNIQEMDINSNTDIISLITSMINNFKVEYPGVYDA